MLKTIKISNDQSVELNSSAGWLLVYREVFGHDILTDIMPMIESGLSLAIEALQGSDIDTNELDVKQIALNIDGTMLSNLFINLSGLETITIMQIIWAMAKNANDDLPPMNDFYNQFETFPFDLVIPDVLRAIIGGMVSSKNAKRLQAMMKKRASVSTKSSSQASTED